MIIFSIKSSSLTNLKNAYEREVCKSCMSKIKKTDGKSKVISPHDEIKVLSTEIGKLLFNY